MSSDDDIFGGLSLEMSPTLLGSGGGDLTAAVETVMSDEEEDEGKRQPLFSGSIGAAKKLGKVQRDLKSRQDEKRVAFDNATKDEGKPQAFIYLRDEPGQTICCAQVKSSTELPVFCGEMLVFDTSEKKFKCTTSKAHNGPNVKRIVELEYPAFYIPLAKTRGRGGIRVMPDKFSFIKQDEVPESMLNDFKNQLHTKAQAKQLMATARQLTQAGEDLVAKKLNFSTEDTLKACYTPGKRIKSSPGGSDSLESWDYVQEAEVPPPLDVKDVQTAVSSLTQRSSSNTPSPFVPDLKGVLQALNKNVGALRDFAQESDKKSNRGFNKVFETTNKLTLFLTKVEATVGDPKGFVGDDDVTTVYEALHFLQQRLALIELEVEENLEKKGKLLKAEMKKTADFIGKLDGDQMGLRLTTDGLEEELKKVNGTMKNFRESTMKMKVGFLDPLKQMYNSVMTPKTPTTSVLARLARLEKNVTSQGTNIGGGSLQPEDLFGSGLSGFYDTSGTEMGSSAQYKRLNAVCNDMQEENAKLRQELNELKELVKATAETKSKTTSKGISEANFQRLDQRVSMMELEGQKKISISKMSFSGLGDCIHFVRSGMVWDEKFGLLPEDFIALLHGSSNMYQAAEVEDVMSRDHYTSRAGFMNQSTANIYASMQAVLPKPLTLSSTNANANWSFPLPRLSKYEYWDKEDGRTGLKYDITQAVEARHDQLMSLYMAQLADAHPDAFYVFKDILDAGRAHWNQIADYLSKTYQITLKVCGDEKEAWKYACEVIKGLLTECYGVRKDGASRSTLTVLTVKDAGRMFWGIVKCHHLMKDFSKTLAGLETHPKLASYVLHHLFRNRVTPKQFETVKGQVAQTERQIKKLEDVTKNINRPKKV